MAKETQTEEAKDTTEETTEETQETSTEKTADSGSKAVEEATQTLDSFLDDEEKTEPDTGEADETTGEADDTSEAEEKTDTSETEDKGEDKGFSESLIALAESSGLTKEQIENFSSEKDLVNTLSILGSKTPTETEDKSKETKKDEDKPYNCGLDPKEYDEKIIATLNKLGEENRQLQKRLANSDAKAAETEKAQQAQYVAERIKWLDSEFAELGEEYEDVFGKGGHDDISQKSETFKNRVAVDDEIDILVYTYKIKGKPLPPAKELFKKAVTVLFSDKTKSVSTKTLTAKMKKRASQALGRGSGKATPATGLEAAKQASAELDAALDDQ